MKVLVIEEAGYVPAIFGLGFSFGLTSELEFNDFKGEDYIINPESLYNRCQKVFNKLAFKDGGHNKALESIQVWLDIKAPRYWWQEFDTYRVGTTKQSESTIHTMTKRALEYNDFEGVLPRACLREVNEAIAAKDWLEAKKRLPESFKQRRIVNTNYKVLRNIILQRKKHKLKLWQDFIQDVLDQIQHPELLPSLEE